MGEKGGIGGIRGENEYGGEKTRKAEYGRGKRFQEGGIIWEIYSKNVI